MRRRQILGGMAAAATSAMLAPRALAAVPAGSVVDRTLESKHFGHSLIGISPSRRLRIYLPPGYAQGRRRYPVLYFLPTLFEDHTHFFDAYGGAGLLDSAIAAGEIGPVILVAADYSTPLGGSLYVNSPVTGNWLNFAVDELVPYIDANFRTVPTRAGRGLIGDRMGGHGAIRFAMLRPETFGALYALHPVGTGSGVQIMHGRPNWDRLHAAASIRELIGPDFFTMVFLAIYQAHLPNVRKPPLYVDLPARQVDGALVIDTAQTARLQDSFFLERMLPAHAEALKSLIAFKFDWGRKDPNYDHVFSNQAFAHKLAEFGVPHEAEEHGGGWGDRQWGRDGRFRSDVLPFFGRSLDFG